MVALATKAELKIEQDKIAELQVLDSSYFRGKSHVWRRNLKLFSVSASLWIF